MEGFEYYTPEGMPNTPDEAPVSLQRMQKEFMELTGQEGDPNTYRNLIGEECVEWYNEAGTILGEPYNEEAELKELTDLLYVIFGYANSKGWDMTEAYKRVHQNNVGRCIQPDGTVKFREDNKVLKNKDYPKVDLSDLVGK